MSEALLKTLHSLHSIMDEETDVVTGGGWPVDIAALAAAKLRLVGSLEAEVAELERTAADWLQTLPAEPQTALLEVTAMLREAAARNAAVIGRQIDLSQELLGAISGEARRLGGTHSQTYRASGRLQHRDGPAPVAINTRL